MTDDDTRLLHHALDCLAACKDSIRDGELALAGQAAGMARETLMRLLQGEVVGADANGLPFVPCYACGLPATFTCGEGVFVCDTCEAPHGKEEAASGQ